MASILFHEASRTFALQTVGATYAFCLHGECGVPVHLHWGVCVEAAHELAVLLAEHCPVFSPEPFPGEGAGSLDALPQELPTHGSGDFRDPALVVRQPDGARP